MDVCIKVVVSSKRTNQNSNHNDARTRRADRMSPSRTASMTSCGCRYLLTSSHRKSHGRYSTQHSTSASASPASPQQPHPTNAQGTRVCGFSPERRYLGHCRCDRGTRGLWVTRCVGRGVHYLMFAFWRWSSTKPPCGWFGARWVVAGWGRRAWDGGVLG